MKPYHLLFLLVVGALIFATAKTKSMNYLGDRQEQQEQAPYTEEVSPNTFHIRMEIDSENDQPVADILWIQEAAQIAVEKEMPWFNVLEQKFSTGSIEGVIQLVKDPMKAEFDAHEILNLHLRDEAIE